MRIFALKRQQCQEAQGPDSYGHSTSMGRKHILLRYKTNSQKVLSLPWRNTLERSNCATGEGLRRLNSEDKVCTNTTIITHNGESAQATEPLPHWLTVSPQIFIWEIHSRQLTYWRSFRILVSGEKHHYALCMQRETDPLRIQGNCPEPLNDLWLAGIIFHDHYWHEEPCLIYSRELQKNSPQMNYFLIVVSH